MNMERLLFVYMCIYRLCGSLSAFTHSNERTLLCSFLQKNLVRNVVK